MENQKNGLAIAGLVLGIIAICTSFIPIINNASFIMGILSVIFGAISFFKNKRNGKAITALILGILSIIITLSLQKSWSDSLDDLSNELDNMSGANTQEVLKNIDVNIGKFSAATDKYGLTDTKLMVKITNKTNEKKSFIIEIEALSSDGSRIDTDYIYANDLSAGQSQSFNLFTYVSDNDLNAMKKANFKVISASMY